MDVVTTLSFFDKWFAWHKVNCGVAGTDVTIERGDESTRLKLTCPTCRNTISGSVSDTDWSQVVQLLKPEKTS
jgi:hypothetical protein